MTNIATKIEFDNLAAFFCGRMISLNRETRVKAAADAEQLIRDLPKFLRNSPHCQNEIEAMAALIERVSAEDAAAVPSPPTIPDAAKLARYDDLANTVEELHDECMALRKAIRMVPTLPTVSEFEYVNWSGTRTEVRCHGRREAGNMPAYVGFSAGGNALQSYMCLTPADARKVAAMLLAAADKAEGK